MKTTGHDHYQHYGQQNPSSYDGQTAAACCCVLLLLLLLLPLSSHPLNFFFSSCRLRRCRSSSSTSCTSPFFPLNYPFTLPITNARRWRDTAFTPPVLLRCSLLLFAPPASAQGEKNGISSLLCSSLRRRRRTLAKCTANRRGIDSAKKQIFQHWDWGQGITLKSLPMHTSFRFALDTFQHRLKNPQSFGKPSKHSISTAETGCGPKKH